jgi:23S rRNA (guanosine2251-2'-O)-methyltransferase
LVLGRIPVLECLRAGRRKALRLYLLRGADGVEEIRRAARGVPAEELPRDQLDKLTRGQVHQGVVLRAGPVPLRDLREWLAQDLAPDAFVAVLDEVADPQNFGAIIRSASALGAGAVIFGKDRAAPLSSAAVKAAAGAVEHVDLIQVANIPNALKQLGQAGFWSTGLAGEADRDLWDIDLTGRCALVFGSEGDGLRRLVRERCDHLARIPMHGAISSLNVSACAAVSLAECLRQRRGGPA